MYAKGTVKSHFTVPICQNGLLLALLSLSKCTTCNRFTGLAVASIGQNLRSLRSYGLAGLLSVCHCKRPPFLPYFIYHLLILYRTFLGAQYII